MTTTLAQIRIILVEPAGPLNIGAIARVMKNMGLHRLVLVNPQCNPLDSTARQMAVHAIDVLEAAQRVDTLPRALEGCQRAIATTVRDRASTAHLEHPRISLPWLVEPLPSNTYASTQAEPGVFSYQSALIFGPEERGLSNTELNYAQRFVRIPSNPEYPSLNLAQAVAVCCYELYQITQVNSNPSLEAPALTTANPVPKAQLPETPNEITPASFEVLEGYYQHLEAVLLKIGYLYPQTTASRMEKFRRLFNRSQLSSEEVSMLRGILSQVTWALQTASNRQI